MKNRLLESNQIIADDLLSTLGEEGLLRELTVSEYTWALEQIIDLISKIRTPVEELERPLE